ncbi:MFS general substrate transporter [Dendrothele bispora CBS 962.96]|uniref:MFS general substrate transporter n=1 Tax=Dendrothele bispora (strain CBS 962.96) TaxID=1314807 RepID=A0A4S8LKQ8_DENBC|nr:MFS general substrate transporter [Dendrothele bispora CBS 962.96]
MGFFDQFVAQFRPSMENSSSTDSIPEKDAQVACGETHDVVDGKRVAGVAKVEALQMVWGKNGKYLLWMGLALMMIIFELDNSTVYNYQTFATSSFNQLSLLAAIQTCQTIVSAVMKPPIAKISDVIGRGETYIFTITCYLLSYFLCASSTTVNVYAGGAVFYAIGQTGTQVLDQIIISDISTARWRGFAIGISYFPFLITPWVSAFIVDSVVGGIGWRWGIGMFAILMPFCASFIIVTLLYYQRKARRAGIVITKRITIYDFCSLIDLGGVVLLSGGFAMLLLPISLAATTPSRWQTPYLDALMGLGVAFLIALIPYEHWVAKHPVLPLRYLRNATIVLSCLLGALDSLGFSATHTYLYAWSIVSHNYSVRDATFLVYTNGVVQCLVGIAAGWIMYKTRRYKYLNFFGVIIRVIGYGIMMRLRGQNNSTAELFIVQCTQGIGSGIIQTIIVVSAQVVVSHAELAQISSLVLLMSFLGSAIGQAIAGGIYTNTFRDRLRVHLPNASDDTIESLFNSITGVLPDWGTNDRFAVNSAYSDVIRYITIVALIVGGPMILLASMLPNVQLTDTQNIFENKESHGPQDGCRRSSSRLA